MTDRNLKKYSDIESCPIRNIISGFSGKWSILVLSLLAESEPTRFSQIGKMIPDISPKVLTDTLKNLENDGLVNRRVYPEIPPRVEYSLTELGKSLIPHLNGLIGWALENFKVISDNRKKKK